MSGFMNDFNIFFTSILGGVQSVWTWLFSTIIGQIILFTIIIMLFIFVIDLIIGFKD